MAGGAADCSSWIRWLSRQIQLIENEYDSKLPVRSAARLLASNLKEHIASGASINETHIFYFV
jgi:20S proteasome alpha/beta subunit